jgi:hypothetical protein
MLDGAGHPFDLARSGRPADARLFRQRRQQLRDPAPPGRIPRGFDPAAAAPARHSGASPREVPVDGPKFSGFIFKIQANMDPRHRDRIAFMRVCSGRFDRDMPVLHAQTGKTVRLSSSHKLFGQERETVDEAWPGDVIGLVGHDAFGIGDTLTEDRRSSSTRSRASRRRSSPTSPTPTRPTRRSSGRAWSSSCRRASSSPSWPARRPPARRSSPPSAPCSSRSSSTA